MTKQVEVDRVSIWKLFILGLCLFVLGALAVETVFTLDPEVSQVLRLVDTGICFLFLWDFLVNSVRGGLNYLKWGWIDLISSIPMIGILRVGRTVRVFRILRILRGARSVKELSKFILARRAKSAFAAAVLMTVMMITFGAIAILQLEKGYPGANIENAEDAIWWALTTVSTVGYGDRFPVTTGGRMVAGALMVTGVGLFGILSGLFASWFVKSDSDSQQDQVVLLKEELVRLRETIETQLPQQAEETAVTSVPDGRDPEGNYLS